MDFKAYLAKFEEILTAEEPQAPYNDPDYLSYTKLNFSRTKRWLKTGKLTPKTLESIRSVQEKQTWIIITEPWCGDAAHSIPFLHMMALENPLISVRYEFRDAEPNRIEQYLTNGSKSIPKLIIRNEEGRDLGVWGPRPEPCQAYFLQSVEDKSNIEALKEALQIWYNQDKGQAIQEEVSALLQLK